jgi:stage V sporulation protein B
MKSKFITSTIILIIGGFIAKFLGMFTKIVITRIIGVEGISLYMLVLPTFLLFITISQLGFPVAVSKIIAENKRSNKSVIFSIIPIALLLSVFLIVIIFFISPIISKLLHNPSTYYPLLSIGLTLPFISISGIIRGYFFGKERMIPHTVSNIFEQIVRLIMIIMITPILLEKSLIFAVCGIILYNIVSEFTSILILYFFLPKNVSIKKKDLVPDKSIIKDVLNISLPTTGSRLIGSLSYFFEPIILTTVLLVVICLTIFGSFEIVNFNIALLFGLVSGTYSTIFIATPICYEIEKNDIGKTPKEKERNNEVDEVMVKGVNS